MFFKCPKCKKVWQYPIEKCPECFLELERMKSEKIKVIGVSRVTIPTMFHPRVPYFVLVLEDENGNKWAQKSQTEYRIGEEFKVESVSSTDALIRRNAVAIWRIKYDILEGIEKVVELLGGPPPINWWGAKVLILPTLISPRHPYFAENTSPQFLESFIRYLTGQGAKLENIKVAGQSFDEISLEACAKKSGLLDICLKNKVQVLDLAKTRFMKKDAPAPNFGGSFEISEEVFNSDLVISLPILKMGKVAAAENVLKFLKKENYLSLKYLYSEGEVVENLTKVLPQYLTIAEALSVQKPDQFIAHLGLILGSFSSLNLERIFAEVSMAKELPECLKKVKIEDIPIIGRKIEEVQYEVEKY